MLLTSICLMMSIMGYGYLRAVMETANTRHSIKEQMVSLAKNLAAVDAHFLQTNEPDQIESLTLHTATVDGIYSVLVTDVRGKPLSEVVNNNGAWSPRYNAAIIAVPAPNSGDSVFEINPHNALQRDFLAGTRGTMTAWHRVLGTQPLGWVRINYRLDTFDAIADEIRWEAVRTVLLATLVTVLLLSLLLRPSMRALREATEFAGRLDTARGARLKVSRRATEIEALGNALNVVSERLLAQHTELSNQKFALDAHAIVSITDLNGDIVYANQRFCNISGYAANELLGKNHRIIKSGEHPAAVFENMWHTITHGEVWHGDIKNRKKNGDHYWVNATIVPLLGQDGLPHHYIGIRTDITANKVLEQRLQTARDEAEAATVSKGQFLANMSHEIRTPMNAILGMLRLLQTTDLNKRQFDYASKAEGAAQTLLGLLNDILDFSKIDAGKMTLELHAFRLDKMMRDVSLIMSSNLGVKPVEILFDIDPAAPKALLGDALRLQQVLINLSANAVKFTPEGEVVVSIRVVERSDTEVSLRFAVRDSGIGIAPENQKHIFEGFSQAEASTTRRFGGTGLGLSISRRLVALMGGELSLQSELGQGSTFAFTVTLPVSADAADSAPALPVTGLQVLVVDDNPSAREVLSVMVTSLGWQLDLAASGDQALALMRARATAGQTPYQAIFMDWQMPGMDGWETIHKMPQASASNPAPILVMITANSRETLTQRSLEDQARLHGFLVKPVTASMLYDAVTDALASSAPAAGKGTHIERPQPLQGLRLLVVEDNMINQQVAQEMLSNQGAVVDLADNGQLGVDAVNEALASGQGFDAVLMDVQMPVMDGYSATRLLRQDYRLAGLPIVAMTANAMASDREACLAAGMNAHVGKPFNLNELVALLLDLIHQGQKIKTEDQSVMAGLTPSMPPEPALPPVDAVDMAGTLERLGGNQSLYVRVLRTYLGEIAGQPEQLETALRSADWVTAMRLLHTLKGLSATVGASFMAAVARKTERAVKVAQMPEATATPLNIQALCAEFRAAVSTTQAVMGKVALSFGDTSAMTPAVSATVAPANLPDTGDQTGASAESAASQVLLGELQTLLQASDMRATEVFEQLQGCKAVADTPEFMRLADAMADLDFPSAIRMCRSMQQA